MSYNQLIKILEKDSDESHRRIGVEIEQIGLQPNRTALRYSDNGLEFGAETILKKLSQIYGEVLVRDVNHKPLGLNTYLGKVSLEPGNQLEFSTNPVSDLHAVQSSIEIFQRDLESITQGIKWVGLGVNPYDSVDQIELIPSSRYEIMTNHFKEKDRLGTSMMRLTASVQINLDYCNNKDAIDMLRIALALAPVSYALFSNSPFSEGRRVNFLSYRHNIWRNTDKDRTGLLPEAFSPTFSLEEYAKLIWNMPLMYLQDDEGRHMPASGSSLRDVEQGKAQNISVNEHNQVSSLRQIFTEARLKAGYIEIRSIDGLSYREMLAATAFFTGIMYNKSARVLVEDQLCSLSSKTREELWIEASREGVKTEVQGVSLEKISKELLQAARKGLKARNLKEEGMLYPLEQIIQKRETPAERWLKNSPE